MFELSTIIQFASEEKSGIGVLGIDVKVILLQAGVFILLFLLVKKFALKGIVDTLEHRRLTIDKGVELGISMEKKQVEFKQELQKLHQQARAEADTIIAKANKEAGEIIKAGQLESTKKVDQMLKDADARIIREIQSAKNALKDEMLDLVSEATEIIIDEKLDASKDQSLIKRALSKVS